MLEDIPEVEGRCLSNKGWREMDRLGNHCKHAIQCYGLLALLGSLSLSFSLRKSVTVKPLDEEIERDGIIVGQDDFPARTNSITDCSSTDFTLDVAVGAESDRLRIHQQL